MNESGFWAKVAKAFNDANVGRLRKLHAGMFDDGLPDGLYVINGVFDQAHREGSGLLELKYVKEWPKRPATPVTCDLTPTQRAWLEDWVLSGGRAHVLLGVADEWFLLRVVEVPDDRRCTRFLLGEIRRKGRHGTMKTLNELPRVVAEAAV